MGGKKSAAITGAIAVTLAQGAFAAGLGGAGGMAPVPPPFLTSGGTLGAMQDLGSKYTASVVYPANDAPPGTSGSSAVGEVSDQYIPAPPGKLVTIVSLWLRAANGLEQAVTMRDAVVVRIQPPKGKKLPHELTFYTLDHDDENWKGPFPVEQSGNSAELRVPFRVFRTRRTYDFALTQPKTRAK